jgi:hypothetical protein
MWLKVVYATMRPCKPKEFSSKKQVLSLSDKE